jgi:hypothetical protein
MCKYNFCIYGIWYIYEIISWPALFDIMGMQIILTNETICSENSLSALDYKVDVGGSIQVER